MLSEDVIRQGVRTYLSRIAADGVIGDDDDVFARGYANSLFAMELVLFIEGRFQVCIEPDDLDIRNFSTVNAMIQLVRRKATLPPASDGQGA